MALANADVKGQVFLFSTGTTSYFVVCGELLLKHTLHSVSVFTGLLFDAPSTHVSPVLCGIITSTSDVTEQAFTGTIPHFGLGKNGSQKIPEIESRIIIKSDTP
jgi:hypothetical protein